MKRKQDTKTNQVKIQEKKTPTQVAQEIITKRKEQKDLEQNFLKEVEKLAKTTLEDFGVENNQKDVQSDDLDSSQNSFFATQEQENEKFVDATDTYDNLMIPQEVHNNSSATTEAIDVKTIKEQKLQEIDKKIEESERTIDNKKNEIDKLAESAKLFQNLKTLYDDDSNTVTLSKYLQSLNIAKYTSKKLKEKLEVYQKGKEDFEEKFKKLEDQFQKDNQEIDTEIKILEKEQKQLEARGENILQTAQQNLLKDIIKQRTIAEINGTEFDFEKIKTTIDYTKETLKAELTEDQQNQLHFMINIFSGKQQQATGDGLDALQTAGSEAIADFTNAVDKEVNKSVAALKNSQVWKEAESILDVAIIVLTANNNDKNQKTEYQKMKDCITLTFKNDKFEFTANLSGKEKETAEELMKRANNILGNQYGEIFYSQFNEILKSVESSPEVNSTWQKIVEAIKLFCEKHLNVEFDKSVNSKEELSKKQDRSAQTIVGNHAGKLKEERERAKTSEKVVQMQ